MRRPPVRGACARSKAPIRWSCWPHDMLIGVRDPLWRAAAGDGQAGRRHRSGVGNLRAGHHRRALMCAISSRAKWSSSTVRACASLQPLRNRATNASAFSNISISPAPTAVSKAATSMKRASASARTGARSAGRRPMSSCRCRIRAFPRRSAMPRIRHSVRARHHPQPLCRPHLHRTDRPCPPSRRQAQA